MSRLDVPTMGCDRCDLVTQDLALMGRFFVLRNSSIGGEDTWDLCPTCRGDFVLFMTGHKHVL